jgi:protein-histidine N-methyltransferase
MTAPHRPRHLHARHSKESPALIVPLKSKGICGGDDYSNGGERIAAVVKRSRFNHVPVIAAVAVVIGAMVASFCCVDQSRAMVQTPGQSPLLEKDTTQALGFDSAQSFISWFRIHGGRVSDKISIAQFEGMGRGIAARAPLEEHEELLFVPLDLIICRETIWKYSPRKLLTKYEKLRDAPTELLTAFLLLEQFKDAKASRWSPYLRMLPQFTLNAASVVATPLFYESDSVLHELQDERMIQAATLERRHAKTAFLRFRRLFKSVLPADGKVAALLEKRYLWVRFLINSRAFSIRGDRFLVPFGDVFNGRPQPNADDRTLSDGYGARFLDYHRLQHGVGMVISADRVVANAYQQIFEDYGDNDNYVYFLYHGFLMEDNPFDCAAVRLPSVNHRPVLKRLLDAHSYGQAGDDRLVCVTPHGTVPSLLEKRAVQFQASISAMGDAYAEALCSSREHYALCEGHAERAERDKLLVTAIRRQLENYQTTIDEDAGLLNRKVIPPSLRHAIQFRISRKQILQSALSTLENNLKQGGVNQVEVDHPTEVVMPERSLDERMLVFSKWIDKLQFPVNHVELKYVDPAMGYGAFATKPVRNGEIYLSVPTNVVMDVRSALRSPFVRELIILTQRSAVRWTESHLLLLHLLHEQFAPEHVSRWRPYLDILPDQERLASPLFFALDGPELQVLDDAVPDDLSRLVRAYRNRVDADFAMIQRGQPSQLPDWISIERFRWANAILDSRSIWWSGTRHLVPLLDMVNCLELSGNHAPHATQLATGGAGEEDAAITRASWAFEKGDHVVENYAQPNYIYLLYHGFVLSENSHDCAHFHFELDLARHLAREDKNRQVVIATMEKMQLYSWSQDVCVGGRKAVGSLDKLMWLALIAESPARAADAERQSKGEITADHIEAATRETRERVDRLAATIARDSASAGDDASLLQILAYVKQQHQLMTDVLQHLQKHQQ